DLAEFGRRVAEVEARRHRLRGERESMLSQRVELAKENRLRQRLHDFALRVQDSLDGLDFEQRQRLLRLVVEQVRVQGGQVEIRLRIPLDEDPAPGPAEPEAPQGSSPKNGVSRNDGWRSLQARLQQDHAPW